MQTDEKIAEILLRPYTWAFTLNPDLSFSARILEFPGCFAEGKSLVDAHIALNSAAESWVLACLETGQPIPEPERWKDNT